MPPCATIAARLDRKGVRAVLTAFKLADSEGRERIGAALRTLALGRAVPTVDAAGTLEWWRAQFPADLASESE